MPAPTAHTTTGIADPPTIGQVVMLVNGWHPGQTEVRVQFPAEARKGPDALAKQAEFRKLVIAELTAALQALSD